MTAVDESYEITASFEVPEGSQAALYLFYNEDANLGVSATGTTCALRIRNENNIASTWRKAGESEWEAVVEGIEVSSMHHNNYNGFFALRPGYLLKGDAKLVSFEYKPL